MIPISKHITQLSLSDQNRYSNPASLLFMTTKAAEIQKRPWSAKIRSQKGLISARSRSLSYAAGFDSGLLLRLDTRCVNLSHMITHSITTGERIYLNWIGVAEDTAFCPKTGYMALPRDNIYVIGQSLSFCFGAKFLSCINSLPFRDFPVHLCSKHKIRLLNFGDNSLYPYLWWIISLTSCTSDNLII